jgi:transketolase
VTPAAIDRDTQEWLDNRRASFPVGSIRHQFGKTMLALAAERPDLLALTADLMFATGIEELGARYPDRLINLGVAEQNMTGVAAGLALCGKLPVVCGYAAFTTLRAVEQAKVDCAYNGVKVILVGQSAGLSYGVGGPTHQTYEDVAIMRAIPNTIVIVPSDPVEVDLALRACVAHVASCPIYVRLGRGPEHIHDAPSRRFSIGQATELRRGTDLCVIANGPLVFEALLAAEVLERDGVSTTVLNMHTVKPIDANAIREAASRVRAILVAEEHSTHGGLGAAVLEVLDGGHAIPVRRIGIADEFPPIGPHFALRSALGLSADNIVAEARAALRMGRPPLG